MDHSRGDICSIITANNVTKLRAMMDDVVRRYALLVSSLPPFLRTLASEFLVGSEEEATENLRQRLDVIAIEEIATTSRKIAGTCVSTQIVQ